MCSLTIIFLLNSESTRPTTCTLKRVPQPFGLNKNCKQVSLTFNYWFSDNTEQICPPDKTSQREVEQDGRTPKCQPRMQHANVGLFNCGRKGRGRGKKGKEGWRKEIHGGSEFHMLPFTMDEQQSTKSICQLNQSPSDFIGAYHNRHQKAEVVEGWAKITRPQV